VRFRGRSAGRMAIKGPDEGWGRERIGRLRRATMGKGGRTDRHSSSFRRGCGAHLRSFISNDATRPRSENKRHGMADQRVEGRLHSACRGFFYLPPSSSHSFYLFLFSIFFSAPLSRTSPINGDTSILVTSQSSLYHHHS